MEDKFMAERKSPLMAIIGKDGPQGFETADGLEIDLGASGEGTKIYIHHIYMNTQFLTLDFLLLSPIKKRFENIADMYYTLVNGSAIMAPTSSNVLDKNLDRRYQIIGLYLNGFYCVQCYSSSQSNHETSFIDIGDIFDTQIDDTVKEWGK